MFICSLEIFQAENISFHIRRIGGIVCLNKLLVVFVLFGRRLVQISLDKIKSFT